MQRNHKATISVLTVLAISATSQATFSVFNVTNDGLASNPNTGALYVSQPGSLPSGIGNRIAEIDSRTGTVIRSVFVGSQPGQIAVTQSGQHAFVALNGAGAFTRVNLSSFTAGPIVSLGNDSNSGPMFVGDLSVAPGSEDTIAVSRRVQNVSPVFREVVIYDGSVPRPVTSGNTFDNDIIEFSSSPTTLFGYRNTTTPSAFYRLNVSSSGVTVQSGVSGLVTGANLDFRMFGDWAVFTTGRIINAETFTNVATLNFGIGQRLVATDRLRNRIYVLSGSGSTRTLTAFSMSNFTEIGSQTFTGVQGNAGSLVQFGGNGIAFRTPTQVFVTNTNLVPEPGTMAALGIGLAALFKKRRR